MPKILHIDIWTILRPTEVIIQYLRGLELDLGVRTKLHSVLRILPLGL